LFFSVLRFELGYQLRRAVFYICLFAAILFAVLLVSGLAETANSVQRQINMNSPVMTARFLSMFNLFGLIIPLVVFGNALLRDQDTGMETLVKASPARLSTLLLARFAAAYIAVCIIFLTLPPLIELALRMPWVDPLIVGPLRPIAKLQLYGSLYLANLFIISALFFAVFSWTRSFAAGYLVIALVVALLVAGSKVGLRFSEHGYLTLADPLGIGSLTYMTRFWPAIAQNEQALPLEGVFLWNRLLWGGIAVILIAATAMFLPRRVKGAKPRLDERAAPVRPQEVRAAARRHLEHPGIGAQLLRHLRHETARIFKSWSLYIFLALTVYTTVSELYFPDPEVLQPFYPIPSMIAPRVSTIALFWGLILLMMITGEAIWRERKSRISEILDATPASSFVFFSAKLAAITLALIAFVTIAAFVGIVFQLQYGTPDLQLDIYAIYIYLVACTPLVMFTVAAMFIHTLAPNKFIGHIATLSFFVAIMVARYWGFENRLVLFGFLPGIPISVMNGLGHYVGATIWYAIYWGGITLLVAVAVNLLWARGQNSTIRMRLSSIAAIEKRQALAASIAALLIASIAGGYIFWNTHIRHGYYTARIIEHGQAGYERKFRRFVADPQPQISEIELAVDIDPHERTVFVRGRYDLVNRTDEPIETIRVQFYDELIRDEVELEGAQVERFDPAYTDYIFRPAKPLAPGSRLSLTYAGHLSDAGFKHFPVTASVNGNGTFIRNGLFAPSIGITPQMFLSDAARRHKHKLSNHMAVIYQSQDRNVLSHDSDLVDLKITVSTSGDQTAIAPGELKRQWTEGTRRYFRYETDQPIRNFWGIHSGRYQALRGKWRDVDLEVYHDPRQGQNAPRMLSAMRQSLDYYSKAFGPFQFRQLRIAEFPYSIIAQSFPSMIAYAEAGFISTPYQDDIIDFTGFVTAHEVAHQWWGHQVAPADMPGAQFLSETLAEYSALMVMENVHGEDHIRSFLQKNLRDYLAQRATSGPEQPLSEVGMSQPHIAYKKGALAMYALKDAAGEATVNRALRRYLDEYRDRGAPYPVAKDLISILREEAGPAHKELITDLFESITIWDFTAYAAFTTPLDDGKWKVTVNAGGQKLDSDPQGSETAANIDNIVDIGLFAVSPDDERFSPQDVILKEKRRINSSVQSFEFVTDRRPEFAAINPYLKLIERNLNDNIIVVSFDALPK
jgi:ABC-type transport system involved in multi-copper enzyme maturation permease subunit